MMVRCDADRGRCENDACYTLSWQAPSGAMLTMSACVDHFLVGGVMGKWAEGQMDAVRLREGTPSARGLLADICSYGNIWENGVDIVDDILSPENRNLLLDAMAEADAEQGTTL